MMTSSGIFMHTVICPYSNTAWTLSKSIAHTTSWFNQITTKSKFWKNQNATGLLHTRLFIPSNSFIHSFIHSFILLIHYRLTIKSKFQKGENVTPHLQFLRCNILILGKVRSNFVLFLRNTERSMATTFNIGRLIYVLQHINKQ